jgi:hypothetical protein
MRILLLFILPFLIGCFDEPKPNFDKLKTKRVETVKTKRVYQLFDGNIIKRKISGTPFFHFGVVNGDKIIHFDQLGVHESTLQEFAKGETVELVSDKVVNIKNNLWKKDKWNGEKYDMMQNNCEHFAFDLVFNEKISHQTDKTFEYLKTSAPVTKKSFFIILYLRYNFKKCSNFQRIFWIFLY